MPTPISRRGFTIVEMLVAMMLLMVVMAGTIQTFRKSSVLLGAQGGRLEAQQNARFAVSSLDRDLRVAGVGIVSGQPLLVEADTTAIVFNADLISRVIGDVGSVYVDTSADSNAVSAMKSVNKLALPGISSVSYPNSTYVQPGGTVSGAETVAYYLVKDSTSSYANQYNFVRRINATAPQVIARGIQYTPGDTVFQFFKQDTTGKLTAIASSSLPLYHKATIHGSIADTGKYALVDSITTIKVKLVASYHDPHTNATLSRTIRSTLVIQNAMLVNATTCGNPPLGVTVTDSTSPAGAATPFVTIMWSHAVDDGGGEKDVERYAIYKRPDTVATWNQPIASVPAGSSTYSWSDFNVLTGDHWVYGVAALDCTPSSSPIGATATIIVP